MDCSLPGSSVHGVFQARALEWGAIAFSNIPLNDPYLHASEPLHLPFQLSRFSVSLSPHSQALPHPPNSPACGQVGNFYPFFKCELRQQWLSKHSPIPRPVAKEILPSVLSKLIIHFLIILFTAWIYFRDLRISIFKMLPGWFCVGNTENLWLRSVGIRKGFSLKHKCLRLQPFSSRNASFFPPTQITDLILVINFNTCHFNKY